MSKCRIACLLTVLLCACSAAREAPGAPAPSPQTPSLTPTQSPSVEPPPTILPPGPCDHLLWPMLDGASWRYDLSLPDGSSQPLTLSVTLAGDSVSLLSDTGSGPVAHAITCAPDGFYGSPGPLVGHPALGEGLTLSSPDAPFLPSADKLLPLGAQASWDARYVAGGVMLLPQEGLRVVQVSVTGGEVVVYASTQALESVTTAAGTFNALAVEQTTLFNVQVATGEGAAGVIFGDAPSRLYWVEGVGPVRLDFEGGMLSNTLSGETIPLPSGIRLDLVEFHLPGR